MRTPRFRRPERVVKALKTKSARLESINDHLLAEISYVDRLLKTVGFDEGLWSLKNAAAELIEGASQEFGA